MPLIPDTRSLIPDIRVVAAPHPFTTERVDLCLPAGLTLTEMIARVQPDPVLLRCAHIYIDDWSIPRERWPFVRPRPGRTVTVRVVPQGGGGGGGKNPLRTVLSIAVIAASFAFGGPLGAALGISETAGASLGIAAGAIQAAVGGAIITAVGTLLINAIAPPPRPKLGQLSGAPTRDSPTLFITGSRNRANPFGVVPRPLGKHRMVPPLGALPFTEIVGEDQYLRMLFVWGYGPLDITDLRIGETPLTSFSDVETETVQGYANDPALTLFPNDVFEDTLSITLTQAAGWQVRTTQPNADEISVDITFPQGLVEFDNQGNKIDRTVSVTVESSPAGANTWTSQGTITVTARRTSAIRRGLRWKVARGQYDVRLRRTTADTTSSQIFDASVWTALRTITNEDPVKMTGLAKTAIRIKATDQLSGVIDTFNGIAHSILPDWDATTQTWVMRATSNPASLYREVLQGAANARPLSDNRLDLANLEDWHEKNAAAGREFNMVIDFASSVRETLGDIAAAGRAAPMIRDGKWGVVIDEKQTVPVQHFTPRNSWGFSARKLFVDLPHGFRVRFANRDADWRQDERIVYDDGYDATNATRFEGLELPGITDPTQAWKDARFHIAVARLRPETYSFFADIEHIVCTRGDLIRVTHDVPLWGIASARVKQVADDGTNATAVVLDERVIMEAGKSYSVRFRKSDGSTLVAAVDTVAGETGTLTFTNPIPLGTAPTVDDLAMFGETGSESVELIVKSIEPGPDLTARIVCLDAAPAVHQADTGPIPPFQSRITPPPGIATPAITDVRSDGAVLLREPDGSLASRILVTILRPSALRDDVVAVEARFRVSGSDGAWIFTPPQPADAGEVSIAPVEDGETYDFALRYVTKAGDRGAWGVMQTHAVVGKSAPPADVVSFSAAQNGDVVNFKWSQVADLDLEGYEIRFARRGAFAWADATPLTEVTRGTAITNAQVPPGDWTFGIKAIDTSGNASANAKTANAVVANTFDIVFEDEQAPGWRNLGAGSGSGFVKHYTGALVPDSTSLAGDLGWELFDGFVPNPVALAVYEAPERDIGFDDTVRVFAEVESALGPGETQGTADPILEIDHRLDARAYNGFEPWSVGNVTARFVKSRIVLDTSKGVAKVTGFKPTVDVRERSEGAEGVAIAAGGTGIAFARAFHLTPRVKVVADGASARIATKANVSTTGFTAHVFDAAGSQVGGTVDWEATGV